jgi:hypothetical protein
MNYPAGRNNHVQVLQQQLVDTVGALGDVAGGLAQGLAGVLQGASEALAPLPRPMPIEVLAGIRCPQRRGTTITLSALHFGNLRKEGS